MILPKIPIAFLPLSMKTNCDVAGGARLHRRGKPIP
jgi:hypothetical protein